MRLLSFRKLLLYRAKTKKDNYTKAISLFKYCFSYKLKWHSKIPVFPWNRFFFRTDFLRNILFIGQGVIQYILSYLLTAKLDIKRSKTY